MKPFVAIIGSERAGKSTIIKSLTGCRTSQFRGYVRDAATGETIEVIGNSPQEHQLSLSELRRILDRVRNDKRCRGVVCALQPTRPTRRLSFEAVLEEALAYRFEVVAFALDPDRSNDTGVRDLVKQRIPKRVQLFQLDARRFAHLSANTINKRTRIAG